MAMADILFFRMSPKAIPSKVFTFAKFGEYPCRIFSYAIKKKVANRRTKRQRDRQAPKTERELYFAKFAKKKQCKMWV